MRNYSISFDIAIHDKATTYPEVKPIELRVKENLPANVDPEKYIRKRIAEELTRQFAALTQPIDNRDKPIPEEDPLVS